MSSSSHLAQLAKTPDNINTEYKLHFIATRASATERFPNASHPLNISKDEYDFLWEKFEENYYLAESTANGIEELHNSECERLNRATVLAFLNGNHGDSVFAYGEVKYAMLEVVRRDLTKVC